MRRHSLSWWTDARPVIGMLHAPPLPGSPDYNGDWPAVIRRVLQDAEALVAGGVHGLLLENYGDAPFFPGRVPAETVACLVRLACEIGRHAKLPLGVNVLRNDAESAVAVALAADADFIRVNVLCGVRVADQGLLHGRAHRVLRLRERLGADRIQILADVDVKHSAPLASRPLHDEVAETVSRGRADAIIVSGAATGALPDLQHLRIAAEAAGTAPVIAGSGVTSGVLRDLWPHADAFIVGSAFEQDGRAGGPVLVEQVREFLAVHRELYRADPRRERQSTI